MLIWVILRRPTAKKPPAVRDTLIDAVAQAFAWDRNRDYPNDTDWRDAVEWTARQRRRRAELGLPQWPY